jgi:hypothetical protein
MKQDYDYQKFFNAEVWLEEFRDTLDFITNKIRQDTLAEIRKEVADIRNLVNPHERWSEKTGKKREREKQLYQGFNEARDKIIKILLSKISKLQ